MKSFIIACVAALVIAIGGYFVLSAYQEPVAVAFASPTGVRI